MKKSTLRHKKGLSNQSFAGNQSLSFIAAEVSSEEAEDSGDSFVQASVGEDVRREIEERFHRSEVNPVYVFPRVVEDAPSPARIMNSNSYNSIKLVRIASGDNLRREFMPRALSRLKTRCKSRSKVADELLLKPLAKPRGLHSSTGLRFTHVSTVGQKSGIQTRSPPKRIPTILSKQSRPRPSLYKPRHTTQLSETQKDPKLSLSLSQDASDPHQSKVYRFSHFLLTSNKFFV